mgnify:CR=1 FL=1
MPLAKINIDGVLRRYADGDALRVNEIDDISHSFARYAARKNTTLVAAVTSSVGDGLSVTGEATDTSTGLWSGKITGVREGIHSFILTGTFANGNTQPLQIAFEVVD